MLPTLEGEKGPSRMRTAVELLPSRPGTYVLALSMQHKKTIQIGKLGRIHFCSGVYAYVGSALGPGGLAARLKRHLRRSSSSHWHIDYLLEYTRVEIIWMSTGRQRREHQWATALEDLGVSATPIQGFGCSDCRCYSHLFHFSAMPSTERIGRILGPVLQWRPGG
jgi:Uri superfamily endonuclease